MVLSRSENELAQKLGQNNKTVLTKNTEYLINGKTNFVLVLKNIENIIFEKGTVLKFKKSQLRKSGGGNVYSSCLGSVCCYPTGTWDPNTGVLTTSC